METVLNNLRAVLCDPEGKCCISGSDADRAIVDEALAILAARDAQWQAALAEQGSVARVTEEGFIIDHGPIGAAPGIFLYTHPAPTNPAAQEQGTLGYATRLAQTIFDKHYAKDEHYASGEVVWKVEDDLMGVLLQIDNMVAGLSRPAAQERAEPVAPADALYDQIKQVLEHHRLTHTMEDEDSGFPLVDMLCPPNSKDIALGKDEITFICDAIFNEVLCLSATPPAPAQPAGEHADLMKFYGVDNLSALAEAQHQHIEKLQAKLPDRTKLYALQPMQQGSVAMHDSDCSTNNRGVPELLGPCDCSHQTRSAFEDFANRRYAPKGYQPERDGEGVYQAALEHAQRLRADDEE